MPTVNFDLDDSVDKESDNLIDLLEVGDCVEHLVKGKTMIHHMVNINQVEFEKDLNVCTAIWKRNGDVMRRYEATNHD